MRRDEAGGAAALLPREGESCKEVDWDVYIEGEIESAKASALEEVIAYVVSLDDGELRDAGLEAIRRAAERVCMTLVGSHLLAKYGKASEDTDRECGGDRMDKKQLVYITETKDGNGQAWAGPMIKAKSWESARERAKKLRVTVVGELRD